MTLSVERSTQCWTLTLERPEKANALSAELVEALIAAIDEAGREGIAVLALRGNGRNLSAGFDFTGFESSSDGDLLQRFVRLETLLQALARSSCLTVGFAHGRNFGAGVDLLAACRWRIATRDATFRMPGLAFGLVLGTRRFASIVGREQARSILESLETFDASRAREMGFLREVAAREEWDAIIARACETSRALPGASRAALYRTLADGTDDADLADLARSAATPGLKDRIARYLAAQRRTP